MLLFVLVGNVVVVTVAVVVTCSGMSADLLKGLGCCLYWWEMLFLSLLL